MNELLRRALFLPPQASEASVGIDHLHFFVILTTLLTSTAAGVLAVYFMARYRRKKKDQPTPHLEAPRWLEALFVVVPLSIFLLWFRIGFGQFVEMTTPPPDALDVYVTGKQWMWSFAYPDGPSGLEVLRVPEGRPVRLLLTSRDVIHVPVLFGIFVVGLSSITSGINFIVTVHTLRAPGITWMRLPLFVWSIYGASLIQIIATPVLGLTLLLVAVEHAFHIGLFDPAVGGDPVLMQHLFWFYSHPAVYITILPAMGVVSEVVSGLSRKNSFGYRPIVYSSLGIAFVGFFTWGHHLFVSGQSTFDAGFFGVASMFVGIFTAIKVFTWIGTMYRGAIAFTTPYAYVCGFIFFLVLGGMTGIALATVSLDAHWHDTYFIVAHFHFVMVGAALMAFLAALHYWFPKMFGRAYPEGWGLVSTVLIILGFNATFIPQFLLGNAGMPRRYYSYPAEFQALNVASTAGATLLGLGFLIIFVYLLLSLLYGERVTGNPWESRGFEWYTASPPVKENFEHPPEFSHAPHDYQAGHPHGR